MVERPFEMEDVGAQNDFFSRVLPRLWWEFRKKKANSQLILELFYAQQLPIQKILRLEGISSFRNF